VSKFTVEQAYTRYVTRTATYLGKTDFQPFAHDFQVEIGYEYQSPAVISEDGAFKLHDDPDKQHARPGSRAPHLWLEQNGKRISSLDLFGTAYVLLAGPRGDGWRAAVRAASARHPRVPLICIVVGADLRDPEGRFEAEYGLAPNGAVLVRPDGFVGWRAAGLPDDAPAALSGALDRLLLKS
jgi:hypothetical protein